MLFVRPIYSHELPAPPQDNLHQLPCQPGSSWLQQMVHLGASLARIQALMTALPTLHGPDPFQVND